MYDSNYNYLPNSEVAQRGSSFLRNIRQYYLYSLLINYFPTMFEIYNFILVIKIIAYGIGYT